MKRTIFFSLVMMSSLCLAQEPEPSWQLLCEGHSNWTSSIKYFTTADPVRFIGPLDRGYGNACEALRCGTAGVLIDVTNRSVELRVYGVEICGCNRIYAPVYSLAVQFGPLPAGDWVFWSSTYQFTNLFTVYSNPPPARLQSRVESGKLHIEWPAVAYLHYGLEASTTLTNWQAAAVTYTPTTNTMAADIDLDTPFKFFRVRRSSMTQPTPSFPVPCGAFTDRP
jgi:hypothetical protein